MTYHLHILGCQMNHSDAERIAAVLEAMGYTRTDNEAEATLLGLVACSVRQKAIDRVYTRIALWNSWKANRTLLTFVSGCILDADREKFLERFDLVFDLKDLADLPASIATYGVHAGPPSPVVALDVLPREIKGFSDHKRADFWRQRQVGRQALESAKGQIQGLGGGSLLRSRYAPTLDRDSPLLRLNGGFWQVKPQYSSPFIASVPIQNGCDKFCTYCAVPYTRGREVSRPASEIVAEVRALVEAGYRSITLLGQNVNSYGLDRRSSEPSFAGLLDQLGQLGDATSKEFWLYFTSPHPRDMSSDVLETMSRYPCIARQVHLPLQSGSDRVLETMNRRYTLEHYRGIVAQIKQILPNATLFTDIIVGFSGESTADFAATAAAMEEFAYCMAFISPYSPRPGAKSADWPDDVEHQEKKRRLTELNVILHRTSRAWNEKLKGSRQRVLITAADERYLFGHNEGRINVRLPLPPAGASLVGQFIDVEVRDVRDMSLDCRHVAT